MIAPNDAIRTTSLFVSNQKWTYHVAGTEGPPLLLLSGSLGANAGTAKLLSERLPGAQLIVPEYAPASTMDKCLTALDAILNEEGFNRIALLGGSFGGFIAQIWTHRNPSRVTHLVLSGTAPPDPSRLAKHARAIRLLPLIPMPVVRLSMRVLLRILLRGIKHSRWRHEYLKLIASLTRNDLKSRYQLAIDFDRSEPFSPLPAPVKVLILEGDRDRVATPAFRERLRQLYPQHQSHVFKGAGHSPVLTHPEEWSSVVGGFLNLLS